MKKMVRVKQNGEVEASPAFCLAVVGFIFFATALLPGLLGGK